MYPIQLSAPKKPRRSRRKPLLLSVFLLFVAGGYSAVTITRPFAELTPTTNNQNLSVTTQPADLPWPSYGQGAFGLANGKVVATHGEQKQVPIASAAKIVTALVILEKHPLAAGASGPIITMTQADVELYKRYVSIQGSVTPVSVGQQLTERQLLQALLLPSANNVADSLAIWSFGSVSAYIEYANGFLAKNGLTSSHIGGDASGYLPNSTSTTSDLVKLGALAMRNAAFAEIVAQKTALIPGTGVVGNYNSLLGSNGIVGIKTGNNDQNGGVFVGAAKVTVGGKTTTVITALSEAPTLARVLRDSGVLLAAAPASFASTTIVKKDAVLSTYRQADGSLLQAVASKNLDIVVLRGNNVSAKVKLDNISYNASAGQTVGTLSVPATDFSAAQSVPIVLKQTPKKPTIAYRLLHP